MKLRAPLKGIYFDAYWTLYRGHETLYPSQAIQENIEIPQTPWFFNKKMLEYIDLNTLANIPQERKAAAYERALKYLDDNHFLMTEDDELKQWEEFHLMLANDLPELNLNNEQIGAIAHSKVFGGGKLNLFDDTIPTLEALTGKYKLGIISDTWPSLESRLKISGIYDYFDSITFSCYLGTWKPNEEMYRHALEQMKFPPEQTVFIDDSEVNLDGAVKCGIQPVLMAIGPNIIENTGKYPSINKLSELLEILPE